MTEQTADTATEFGSLTAAVTGGASGIGLATATELARRGARVVALDLRTDQLPDGLYGEICDVTDRASVHAALTSIGERFGGSTSSSTTRVSAPRAPWPTTTTPNGTAYSM